MHIEGDIGLETFAVHIAGRRNIVPDLLSRGQPQEALGHAATMIPNSKIIQLGGRTEAWTQRFVDSISCLTDCRRLGV